MNYPLTTGAGLRRENWDSGGGRQGGGGGVTRGGVHPACGHHFLAAFPSRPGPVDVLPGGLQGRGDYSHLLRSPAPVS